MNTTGAKGSGKSFLARYAAIAFAMNVPGLQVYIFRESYKEVKRNYLFGAQGLKATLAKASDAGLCNVNESEPCIYFKNGSAIYLTHMKTPQDVEKIRGQDVHMLIADEAAQWLTRDIYNQLRTCMRCSLDIDYKELADLGMDFIQPGFFPRALLLSNPGGVAHTFIKQAFIDNPDYLKPYQMDDDKGGMIRQFIPAFLTDNDALLDKDPKYRAKLLASGKHMKSMLKGDWNAAEGMALSEELSPKWNVLPQFEIPHSAIIKRCFDWGHSKPFACSYVWETRGESVKLSDGSLKFFPSGSMVVVGEVYGWNGEADEGCRKSNIQIGEALKRYEMIQPWASQIVAGPSDGSMWNGTGTDKNINDQIIDGYNAFQDAEYPFTQRYVSSLFTPADKSHGSRVKGLSLMQDYLKSAHPLEMTEIVDGKEVTRYYPSEKAGLYFMNNCFHCLRTLPFIPYDPNKPDDVDTKSEDHIYDTVRYAVLGRTAHYEWLELTGL